MSKTKRNHAKKQLRLRVFIGLGCLAASLALFVFMMLALREYTLSYNAGSYEMLYRAIGYGLLSLFMLFIATVMAQPVFVFIKEQKGNSITVLKSIFRSTA